MTLITETQLNPMSAEASLSEGLEWLHKNTNFPTFETFKLNPDKWRQRPEELFESIDDLSMPDKARVKSVKYFWKGEYECDSLARIWDISMREGIDPADGLEMQPIRELMDGTSEDGTRIKVTVNVWPKEEFKKLGGVVANA